MAKKKSTLVRAGNAVTGAATTVANAANENVLKPVGRALGLVGDKKKAKPARTKKSTAAAKKPAAKRATAAKKPAAKKK